MVDRVDREDRGLRVAAVGMAVNLGLAGIKGAAGILGHSQALVADAIESGADVAGSLIVVHGLRVAALPPDRDHPYGHGKAEPLTALAVAGLLLVAAAVIVVQSVHELFVPHHVPEPYTLAVLVGVIAVKEGLFRWVWDHSRKRASVALAADAWHHRSDALTSAAAFVGISIAVAGGPGYESADDWAALAASAVIVVNAVRLLRPALAEVMDAAPADGFDARVRETALRVPDVRAIDACLLRKMGLHYYADLHVEVDAELTVRRGHAIAHEVKDAIRREHPRVADVLIHVEPHPKGGAYLEPQSRTDSTRG